MGTFKYAMMHAVLKENSFLSFFIYVHLEFFIVSLNEQEGMHIGQNHTFLSKLSFFQGFIYFTYALTDKKSLLKMSCKKRYNTYEKTSIFVLCSIKASVCKKKLRRRNLCQCPQWWRFLAPYFDLDSGLHSELCLSIKHFFNKWCHIRWTFVISSTTLLARLLIEKRQVQMIRP